MDQPDPVRLLLLSEADNVLIALGRIEAGLARASGNVEVTVDRPVTLGHKVARVDIAKGEKIIKYGVPIGSATKGIRAGQHVHVHNIQSDYTATYSLSETEEGARS